MEMVNVNATWEMPRRGAVKINVHGFFSEIQLANGNRSGIGVVVINSRGTILRMLSGSLGINERGNNELYAYLEGLKRAYAEDYPAVILETDHVQSYWEWKNSTIEGGIPEHAYVLKQLNTRRRDKNFALDVRLTDPEDNELAAYLAEYGASRWNQMVVIKRSFGRVYELWSKDMGLGPVGPQFRAVNEEEMAVEVMEDGVINPPANMFVMVEQNDEEFMQNENAAFGDGFMVQIQED
ncbi:hypothetical protein POM88_007724 [Heracleum sosnowskyi]|uniref:RNase H type-1 domain-containing protein n=1 Tax=Heracleum sosnowskyi TaxID=360622 RepID=A0AAD8N6Q9_9APIA|nr:hypothetical protein POM88_007724 [Heracleum sosnowskyi]